MRAILSDVHGNAVALRAVLEDIQRRGITEIISLGDLIGYGPEPIKCLELARSFNVSLMGNHEEAVLFEPEGFSRKARSAVEWTRRQLSSTHLSGGEDPFEFVGSLLKRHSEGSFLWVHGSPREPTQEYIFPNDTRRPKKLKPIFSRFDKVCFVGHTHYAGVITENMEFFVPPDLLNVYMVDQGKAIINVGSVGQPRDGNPKAGYVTFDGDSVVFHRVPYDVQATADMIYKIPQLDNFLGSRLFKGK
jgi:diadenosine tetraphosphatase ApaH/serine/threonine PP2A family protein phosphatase